MEENNIIINQVDPKNFEYQQYTEKDNILISSSRYDTVFSSSIDYIEYYAYDGSQNLIFPNPSFSTVYDQRNYKVINGDVIIYPSQDLEELGYDQGTFYSTYNFYRKRLGSDINVNYYIDQISSDRTELRLKSTTIPADTIISSSLEFIDYRESQDYYVDFLLNFGADQQVIANNIKLDTTTELEPSVLIKLYEELPSNFELKDTLWVVEEISTPQAYEVIFPPVIYTPDDFEYISGPNYSIQATQQTGESGQEFNFETLMQSDVTSSVQQLKSLLDKKEINISVDYTDYNDFIYFSSALTRLENFYYKAGLIESSSNAIANLPTNSATYSASKAELNTSIDNIIKNFDGYEYFLYFNSGSEYSYPKSNTEPPYTLYSTGSSEVLNWLGSADPGNAYYGGQALSASNYDTNNANYLYNTIPEYLRDDSANQKYLLFVDMVAQQYDNSWQYVKNITTRFNADNRLDYGISKDLVADAIKDFGVKLYSNNFNTNDLYTAFLGLTPSGSSFPIPDVTGSYPAPSGFEYVDNQISGSDDIIPLDDTNKRLYKRIYHNIPYLLKTKGTLSGLRALITSYGIPDTILRVNEFGGKDRNNFKDWDYSENVFNYALHLDGVESRITSSFIINSDFQTVNTAPRSLQFRFKTPGIPTSSAYYNVWVGDSNRCFITLEYTGSGLDSGSYSGSIPSESNAYGNLKLYPDGTVDTSVTASISLPFFDGGWWSVMATIDYDNENSGSLYAANRIGENIGFSQSAAVGATTQYWKTTSTSSLPSASALGIDGIDHHPLTGALQEVRYWDIPLSESLFYDYVVNPYSTQGNTINSTPDDLVFRADLGTELNTGSRTSIHPKVTGSWEITSSFVDGTSDFFLSGSFIQNTESIYLNQVPGGIKNRISDKIKIDQEILPTGSTLSPYRSIQQDSFPSGSSPNINYLEVAFSPTDQINDDIIAQIGAFNLGDYIGDPRQISQSGVVYPELNALRDAYFTKYIKNYNVNDFIRLIKFLDNSLFKMIEDFTPARTSLSSGVVVKQNLLERNRVAPPSASYTTPEYSGSVKSFARDYQVPNSSSSFPQGSTISGSSIEVFRGGAGGTFEPYNSIYAAPISSSRVETCAYNYIYSGSYASLSINTSSGYWTLDEPDATDSNNTMSINVSASDNQIYASLFSTVSSSANNQINYIKAYEASNPSNNIIWRVDKSIFYGGYNDGDSIYAGAPYGDYSNMYQFFLTVHENNLTSPTGQLTDQDIFTICFDVAGEPYSGESAATVTASSEFYQYPDYQQAWSESIVPSLGITPAYQEQHTSSNAIAPVTYQRLDQREFYNGEFGSDIPVGLTDVCSAFFGQNDIIDYFFFIQWFNESNFPENNFLSSSFLPLAGNIWLWADTISPTGRLALNQNLLLSAGTTQPASPSSADFITTDYTTSGNGTPGRLFAGQNLTNQISAGGTQPGNASSTDVEMVTSTYTTSGTGVNASFKISAEDPYYTAELNVSVINTGSLFNAGDTITITAATLSEVFTNANTDLVFSIPSVNEASFRIVSSGESNNIISVQATTAGVGFQIGDTITISSATLVAGGIANADTDVVIDVNQSAIDPFDVSQKVRYIKMSNVDTNGTSILPYIQDSEYITLKLTGAQDNNGELVEGFQTWYIANVSVQDDDNPSTDNATLLIINEPPSSVAVTSYDSQFYDLTFSASGIFSYYATASGDDPTVTPTTGISASIPQGYFPPTDRSPGFSTESFFRGWGKSNYFQSNEDGSVYRVTTGSGFSTDTLGNFNTGSVEMDFDSSIPYTSSITPWFTNAPAATIQALNNSSLVGGLATGDLQLYTGSITASATEIPITFITESAPTPVEDESIVPLQQLIVTIPTVSILISCPNTAYGPTGNPNGNITVDALSNVNWTTTVTYQDGNGWVNILVGSTGTESGFVTFSVNNAQSYSSATPTATLRRATITITNDADSSDYHQCFIEQTYFTGGGGNGGLQPIQL